MNWFGNTLKKDASLHGGPRTAIRGRGTVQVIVYAHGPTEGLQARLGALLEGSPGGNLLIVQDSTDDSVCEHLARFAGDQECTLVQNLDVLGFQRSVAKAMRISDADLLAVVDSDVVVTSGGLYSLVEELSVDPAVELAFGLLDVQLMRRLGSAPSVSAELIVAALESRGNTAAPDRVLSSFTGHPCFALRRSDCGKLAAWETARCNGPEVDVPSFRARMVPGCYASYRSDTIPTVYRPIIDRLESDPTLMDGAANAVADATHLDQFLARRRVLFLLASPGGTGGTHSLVQEVAGLRRCGLDVTIANRASNRRAFEQHYPGAGNFCSYFADEDELCELASDASFVVATNHASVALLKSILDRNPMPVPMYYVQDYEPWFYAEQDPRHAAAKASYHLVPNQIAFAKTDWLCDTVRRLEGIEVVKVSPGLDRMIYNSLSPGFGAMRWQGTAYRVTIAAMIRPSSERRNPGGTLKVLRRIQRRHARTVDVRVFGCSDEDLDLVEEAAGFRFVNLGVLKRQEVADVLRGADIFVDLSTYQAFGCTGLEAMATGCATVLPRGSGVEEYAVHGENCLLVDPVDEEAAVAAVEQLITDGALAQRIRSEAPKTARRYSVGKAVWSQLCLFEASLALNAQPAPEVEQEGISVAG